MKLLFDQNLSYKLARRLDDVFPNSSQVKLLGMDEANDSVIWDYSRDNGFALVSKDSDYFERSVLFGHPPKVIWLRCGNRPTSHIEWLIRSNVDQIRAFEADTTKGCLEIY